MGNWLVCDYELVKGVRRAELLPFRPAQETEPWFYRAVATYVISPVNDPFLARRPSVFSALRIG